MKPNYNNFLKTWSTENKITSFFGSDKPDFLKAWSDIKNEAVKKKEVVMKPKEEEINYYKKVENMTKEERSKLLSELRKATERTVEIRRLKSKKAELEREELDKIILSPLYGEVKTFIENEQIRKADEARKNLMKPKQIIFEDEPLTPKNKKEDLINEWNKNTLPILLYQLYPEIYQYIEKKVLQLNNKNLYILPTEIAYFLKDFLNDLFVKYGQNMKALNIILAGINNIIEDIIPNYKEPEEKNYRNMMKYFNAKNKKIIGNLTR